MLCDILALMKKAGVWERMPRTDAQNLVISIVDLACKQYDCNAGEILEGHDALGICYVCRKPTDVIQHGMCVNCRDEIRARIQPKNIPHG